MAHKVKKNHPSKIGIKPCAIHIGKPYPVPKIHKEVLKKEMDRMDNEAS